MVTFVLGCSFTFEQALLDEGIALRHVTLGSNVAMYRTNIDTEPAGPFHGPMVVSMRPLAPAEAERAAAVTAHYPRAHGAPIHQGRRTPSVYATWRSPTTVTLSLSSPERFPCSGPAVSRPRPPSPPPGCRSASHTRRAVCW